MGFNDFFQRENVYNIIIDTLKENGVDLEKEKTNNHTKLFSFPRLNIMGTKSSLNRANFLFVCKNSIGNQNFIVRMLMFFYILLCFLFPNLFSDCFLYTKKEFNKLIYPGNKKIKIIDVKERTITNYLKSGFSGNWFNKEIKIRQSKIFHFVPEIIEFGDRFYVERLLDGKSFARLNEKDLKLYSQNVNEFLFSFKNAFSNSVSIDEYSKYLGSIIEKNATGAIGIDFSPLLELKRRLVAFLDTYKSNVELCFSHGDFQKGNLFIERDEKIYVIDWETYANRSNFYDKLVFYWNFRNSNILPESILNFFKRDLEYSDFQKKSIVSIFILEDLVWQFDELNELQFGSMPNGLKNYLSSNFCGKICDILNI